MYVRMYIYIKCVSESTFMAWKTRWYIKPGEIFSFIDPETMRNLPRVDPRCFENQDPNPWLNVFSPISGN